MEFRHCEERSDEAIQRERTAGLLRFARNDDRGCPATTTFLKTNPEFGRWQENVGFPEKSGGSYGVALGPPSFALEKAETGHEGVMAGLDPATHENTAPSG